MFSHVRETINQSLREQFEVSWMRGAPQSIEQCLPSANEVDFLPTLEELIRIEMERSWQQSKTEPGSKLPTVEDYLQRFPEINQRERLVRLIRQEHYVRHTFGDQPSSDSYAKRFPELIHEVDLAQVLPTVTWGGGETVANDATRPLTLPTLGDFGDYELLSQLGEGGMGVVYRARQKRANRLVALKVIHAERSGSSHEGKRQRAIDRFRTESQAAARLEHENIVPVYDVGQVGEHLYFSMRLVEGKSLNEIVRGGPLENRKAAEYLRGVTAGVAEAHRHGILHRDLKPHNVMVDTHSDRPLVADFGLAKVVESDDQLTRSGEVIGTPSYMPPEQIGDAAQTGETGDIYSLGATLYHLLTGRPPFQAASTLATMRQVIYEEPVALRRLNADVDKDLETICLKCLQKEPSQRYTSAIELGEDLTHYLAGEPILARPIGPIERTVRWCRRNPLSAGLTALAMCLAVAVFLSVMIGYQQTNAALEESERNFQLARETVDELYTDVAEIDLKNAPGMQPFKEKLLARSLTYYQRLLAERRQDAELTIEFAQNHYRVGRITEEIGASPEAGRSFEKSANILETLLKQKPNDLSVLVALGDSLNALGRIRQRSGDFDGADLAYVNAQQVRSKLVELQPNNSEYERKLANVEMNRGLLELRRGNSGQAARQYEVAQQMRKALLAAVESDDIERDFAKGAFNQGALAAEVQDFKQSADFFQLAIDHFAPLAEKYPESLSDQFSLAVSKLMLADSLQLQGQFADALSYYAQAESQLQMLVDDNPRVLEYQEQLVTCRIGRAQLALRMGQDSAQQAIEDAGQTQEAVSTSREHYELAERILLSASAQLQRLVDRNPTISSYLYDLSVVLQMLGDVQLAYRDTSAARAYFQRAKKTMEELMPSLDQDPSFQEHWQLIEDSLEQLSETP